MSNHCPFLVCAANSAYYGKPINIVIKKCDLVQESPSATVFDREVDLTVDGKVRQDLHC